MFEKILVALDGSELAARALVTFEPLLRRPSAELVLVRVVRGSADATARASALDHVRRLETELSTRGLQVGGHLLVGDDPAHEIVSFAAKSGASVIGIATHGRTGLRRLVLGSVAETIVRTADRPVILVNPWASNAPLQLRRVLVPLDGSERADEALPIAAELAREFASESILLHVEELGILDPAITVAEEHRRTTLTFERARRALGGSARTIVKVGRPAEEALAAIAEEAPDLVLLTTHGRTGLARAALGSVAEAIIHRAACPVLVMRNVPSLAAKRHDARATTR